MNENTAGIDNGLGDAAVDAQQLDEAHKRIDQSASGDVASDLVSGIVDIAGDVFDSVSSEAIEGVVEAAGNVVGTVLGAAGELLGGIFD